MEIVSKNNQTIKDLKKQKDKNRFLLFLDTPKMVKEALKQGFRPLYIFILKEKHFDFLENQNIIYTSEEVLKSLSSVQTNAGIIGVFEMKKFQKFENDHNFLVLDNVQDAGNVGAILRSALACNFKTVFLLDCAKVSSEKVVRSSAGAVLNLNLIEISRQDFLKNYTLSNLYYADMGGVNIFKQKPSGTVGIVMGNEGNGVSDEIKSKCTGSISLPMQNNLESLNVAVSAGVIMYQICYGGEIK